MDNLNIDNLLDQAKQQKKQSPYDDDIRTIAKKYGIPEEVAFKLVKQESSFNPKARSSVGAQGLTQLMPDTAKALGVKDAYDPKQNLEGGFKYLNQLSKHYNGNMRAALAHYNGGPTEGERVARGDSPDFRETKEYINKISPTSDIDKLLNQAKSQIKPQKTYLQKYSKIDPEKQAQLEQPIKEGFSTPDPIRGLKGMALDPLGMRNIARSAEDVGRRAGSGQSYGPQAAGLVGQSALAIPSIAGAVLGPIMRPVSKLAGTGLSKLAELPFVKPVTERLLDGAKTLIAKTPFLEHQLMKSTAYMEADVAKAFHEVAELGEKWGVNRLSKEARAKIYDAYEASPSGLKTLLPNEHAFLQELLPIKEHYTQIALKEELIEESHERYLTHLYENKTKKFVMPLMKTMPQALKRSFSSFAELEKTQREFAGELGQKGLTVEKYLAAGNNELKQLGLTPKMKQVMSLKPIKDPVKALQSQILGTQLALATKKHVLGLLEMKNEAGDFLIEHQYKDGYIKLDSPIFNKYVAKGSSGRAVFFREQQAFVRKEVAPMVKRLLNTRSSYPEWLGYVKEINRAVKQLSFYNPVVHDINLVSNSLQAFGANISRVLGIPGKYIANDPARLSEAISDGFVSNKFYEIKRKLQEDFGYTLKSYHIPGLSSALDQTQKINNKMLWTYAEHLGLTAWNYMKSKLISQGIPRSEAGKAAVAYAEDIVGKMSKTNTMALFRNPYVNQFINFIPAWVNSSWRKYIGAVLPQQAFKHLAEPAQKALAEEYRQNLIRGVTLGMFFSQRLNYALTGHSTFENQPQNRPSSMRPFGRIEGLHFRGKEYAVDFPAFGSLTLPPRMIAAIYNVTQRNYSGAAAQIQPITRLALTQGTGMEVTGKPMFPQGTPLTQQVRPRAESALKTFNPLGMGIIHKGSDAEDEILFHVLPVRVAEMKPSEAPIAKMWGAYRLEHPYEVITLHEQWMDEVDKILQKPYQELAQEDKQHLNTLVVTHNKTSQWLQNRMLKNTVPITYSFQLLMRTNKREFQKYYNMLSPDEKDTLQQSLREEQQNRLRK